MISAYGCALKPRASLEHHAHVPHLGSLDVLGFRTPEAFRHELCWTGFWRVLVREHPGTRGGDPTARGYSLPLGTGFGQIPLGPVALG